MSVDLGRIIKRTLELYPFNTLSVDDQIVAAGVMAGAMQEAISEAQLHSTRNPPDSSAGRGEPNDS